MAKKQLSFAEKAAKKKGKGLKSVKFIKSILSEKSGHWRFKEKMVQLFGRIRSRPLNQKILIAVF